MLLSNVSNLSPNNCPVKHPSVHSVMSKIIPVKEPKYYASRRHEHAEVCPRLEKWMEKANSGGFVPKRPKKPTQASTKSRKYLGMFPSSKRKRTPGSLRGSPNRRRLSSKRFRESGKRSPRSSPRKSPRKPIRAKTIFNNIRQKSRNFGIRCKTSVSLWKQWIVNGIKWDKHNPLSFPRLKSKSSTVNDIDNIPKSKRSKNELDGFSSNSVISDTIHEVDEPPDAHLAEKKPAEVSKVKKFLDMSYLQKATSIFWISKPKEAKAQEKNVKHLSPIKKVINSPTLEKLDVVHEEDDADNNDDGDDDDDDQGEEQVEDEDGDDDATTNDKIKTKKDDVEEYEEVDDVTISDRDLKSNKFHPMQKLAQIDTEKIENIENRTASQVKHSEYDEFYDDDIYYDHHLNGYYRTEADPIGDEMLRQKARNKNGAIHRAFNKLKLFF